MPHRVFLFEGVGVVRRVPLVGTRFGHCLVLSCPGRYCLCPLVCVWVCIIGVGVVLCSFVGFVVVLFLSFLLSLSLSFSRLIRVVSVCVLPLSELSMVCFRQLWFHKAMQQFRRKTSRESSSDGNWPKEESHLLQESLGTNGQSKFQASW